MMSKNAVVSAKEQRVVGVPFKKGQSGNPAGRPVGIRARFGEDFLQDFTTVWDKHGLPALTKMAEERPTEFVKAAVQILPKDALLPNLGDGKVTITWEL